MRKLTSLKQRLINWVKKNRWEAIALLIILLAAAFLRLFRINGYMTFLGDEGRDVLVVKRMIVDHKLTLLGPTASVGGFFLGPIYYYLMIPFLWLFRLNPVGPAVMVALFGIATVYLVYQVGKDFFGASAGLIAASLYAVSPVIIAYSRSSWNPNLMPFFSLLIIYLLWLTVKKKKLHLLGLVGFLLGITFQLHYLATFLVPIIVIYLLFLTFKKENLKNYCYGLGGFFLGWSPFLLFEIRHQFPNLLTLYRFVFFGKETGLVPGHFLPTISEIGFRLFPRLVTNNNLFLGFLTMVLSLVFFILFGLQQRKKKKELFLLLTLWLVLGVGLFGFYQKAVYDYYLGFLFPLPFLLTGLGLSAMKKWPLTKILAGLLFSLLIFLNLQGMPFRYTPNHQLNQAKAVAQSIFEAAQGKPFNFALITGQNSDHAYRYFLEIWGTPPVTIENPQIDPERKTVTDQLFVVCETLPCAPLGHSLWEIAGFGRAEIEKEWEVSVIKVFKLKPWHEEETNR